MHSHNRHVILSCIMWQSGLAACGHVGVVTRASGVLLMTRRGACVHACSGSNQWNVINRRRRTCLNLSVEARVLFSRLAGGYSR